ncbi:hypothetical protein MNEG_9825 [Monoraphidium neglectum]|uniref:Hydroxylamine reductase n=1 Tax=Monoraphidium neglectum TaxID=145388 RepID=A0A0D2JF79_9CHLO|nr:hypothetical protein MNEG_9825 [Monoraphidium neglectum]KIY98137.1 hypothetical protein MNEG_9825 [Monoraphidium neglectum]|eukprot:XP_013897157.1 hypothetical protein MNEG_9825 [Monoraphidium neglectum]
MCNDAYGAVMVASELAKAFNCSVNDLPLSLGALMAVTWIGPKLPAFITPEALQIVAEKFNIMPASLAGPEEDLKKMMANK